MATSTVIDQQEAEKINRITRLKLELGSRLVILGHYYQRLPVTLLSDHLGDSFGLSAKAAKTKEARHIVFCGVEFMAESAEILRAPQQEVFHPNPDAGCPMADMADAVAVERAFEAAGRATGGKVIPVAYMNTSAGVKAFCGRNGGIICTSSNADRAFRWAYDQGDVVLFIPDEHLGRNTADSLGIPEEARTLYDPYRDADDIKEDMSVRTKLVLWKGYCHVHTWFTTEQIDEMRIEHPEALVIVHPECPREVVAAADQSGSTAVMHRFVKDAPKDSTVIVGTEMNMVAFLQHQYGRDKTVLPLSRSFCPNMFKINLDHLIETLENLSSDRFRVHVPDEIKSDARIALERMLDL